MNIVVRSAEPSDVSEIFAMGRSDGAFAVSDRIQFYERTELEEWISLPQQNILLVIDSLAGLIGFSFCKIMSHHWAMLDNFYVRPAYRGRGFDRTLMEDLLSRLEKRRISYLTAHTARNRASLARYLRRFGFQATGAYVWNELFLDHNRDIDAK